MLIVRRFMIYCLWCRNRFIVSEMATVDEQADAVTDPQVLYELKQQAIEYYKDNGVPQKWKQSWILCSMINPLMFLAIW